MKILRSFFPRSYDGITQEKNLKLYFSYYSPPARAVYLVTKALDLIVDIQECDILSKSYLTPELMKINPQHTIPTLQDDDFVIWDSHAISGYLANKYGPDDSLYPQDPQKRAIVDQRLHFDTENLFPRIYETIYPILFRRKTTVSNDVRAKVKQSYNFLERFLRGRTWLAGENLTIADLCCVPSISTLDTLIPISSREFPKLTMFLENCKALPYYYDGNQFGLNMLNRIVQNRLVKNSPLFINNPVIVRLYD